MALAAPTPRAAAAAAGTGGGPAEFGDGAGEHVLDEDPFGSPVAAQVVEEADDGDHVGPRVEGGAGRLLPQGGEPLCGIGAESQQVDPAVRDVGGRGAG